MNCETAQNLSNDRLDGMLAPAEEVKLETHLAACSACAEEARILSEALSLVADAPLQSPSLQFNAKVIAALHPDTRSSWLPYAGAAFGLGMAGWSAAAIAAIVWFLDPSVLAQWAANAPSAAELPGLAAVSFAKIGLRAADILSLVGTIGRSLLQTMDPATLFFPLAAATVLSAGILTSLTRSGTSVYSRSNI